MALDDLTGLISPRRIIYCEGKDNQAQTDKKKVLTQKFLITFFTEDIMILYSYQAVVIQN